MLSNTVSVRDIEAGDSVVVFDDGVPDTVGFVYLDESGQFYEIIFLATGACGPEETFLVVADPAAEFQRVTF